MKIAMLIACSAGKTLAPSACFDKVQRGITPLQWLWMLGGELTPAEQLYTGETFRKLRAFAPKINADLWIASAGLGLVRGTKAVPSYEASFSNEVAIRVCDRYAAGHSEWFKELTRLQGGFPAYDLVIACVPDSYERPVLDTLGSNVLFITTKKGLPRSILYDRRLNDPSCPYKGRDVDFKARAFAHYVENVFPGVAQSDLDLSMYEERKRAVREKFSDDELRLWLETNKPKSPSAAYASLLAQGTAIGIKRLRRFMEA